MARQYKKVFVTVGTTCFDELCEVVQSLSVIEVLKDMGCEKITIQIGNSYFNPGDTEKADVKLHLYNFKDSLEEDIRNSDLVISHAGAGSCLEILEAKKPLLVVVNDSLMDNHQMELAEQLHVDGHVFYCTPYTLEGTLQEVDFNLLVPYSKADITIFRKHLDDVFRVVTC